MLKKITIISFFIIIVIAMLYSTQDKLNANIFKDEEYIRADKLIKSSWSNMSSWIFLYDPSIEDYQKSVILEVSFHKELEGMSQGGEYSKLTDKFINLVNSKYDNGIELSKFAHKKKMIELIYVDETRIIWNYGSIKKPTELTNEQ